MKSDRLFPSGEEALAAGAFLLFAFLFQPLRDFPLNDDWAYAWSVRHWMETGSLRLSDWTSPTIVLQLGWGALFCPFGFSHAALRFSTMVLASAAVGLFYGLVRRGGASRSGAALAAAALAVQPLFLNLSLTFMTDVPFLALTLLALRLGEDSLLERRGGLAACGLTLAAACLVRQNGILMALGLAVFLYADGSWTPTRAAALLLPSAAALAAHSVWLYGIHGVTWAQAMYNVRATSAHLLNPPLFLADAVRRLGWTALYAGLASLPMTAPLLWSAEERGQAWTGWRQASGPWRKLSIAGTLFALGAAWSAFPPPDGLLTPLGLGPVMVFGRGAKAAGLLSSRFFWAAAGSAGAVSFGLLALLLARPWPQRRKLWAWAFVPMLAWIFAGSYFSDRYLLILMPAVLALASSPPRRGAWAVLALLAVLSSAGELDYLNSHGALWRGARSLAAAGLEPRDVGGSLEWVAWHNYQDNMDELKRGRPLTSIRDADWLRLFQERRRALVTFASDVPRELFDAAGEESYFSPLTLRRERVFLYRRTRD